MPSRCNSLGPQRQPAHSLASNRRTAFWPLRRLIAINSPLHHLRSYACRCTHHIIRRFKPPTPLGCSSTPARDRARAHCHVTFYAWSAEASSTSRATRADYSSGAQITAKTCTAAGLCLCASWQVVTYFRFDVRSTDIAHRTYAFYPWICFAVFAHHAFPHPRRRATVCNKQSHC
jgi:hypothetical protein